jgi:oxygen-independent coproporphyrinogen-3 oxidase
MALGLYLSVPFCRTKCTYCNFASEVFSRAVFQRYVDRVSLDIERANSTVEKMGGRMEHIVDSVYLGGGTPTVLDITHLKRLFVTISQNFDLQAAAEITVECAPGTLSPAMTEAFQRLGVNRVSLGVQSFVDEEAHAVGRLHDRLTVMKDVTRLREAGISNVNIDLIAGLPHQTTESWEFSLEQIIASGTPHASVYMLEVDEDSRLGRELIAGGTRYHAHFVPDDELTANFYEMACEQLETAGVHQYEISNFARPGCESRHNLKYWTRQPYLGFGMDAHSMLTARAGEHAERHDFSPRHPDLDAVRFSTSDSLEEYLAAAPLQRTVVSARAAMEETFFLGLRLTRGVDLQRVKADFGEDLSASFAEPIAEFIDIGLMEQIGGTIWLTPRGRLLSNEVFDIFISPAESVAQKGG